VTTPDLVIRPFEPADAEAVVAVHEAAFRASGIEFVAESAVDEELKNVTASYLEGGDTFLVGTVDGEVVATGGYRTTGTDVAEMGHLRVHPEYQRRGYAAALVDAIEDQARDEGIETMVLETHEDLVAAQALYEVRGYEVDHTEPHAVTGDTMIHYAKEL
jgi:ribosomal protein S18 acetylase RimI-like enzyme